MQMVDWGNLTIQLILPILTSGLAITAFTSFYNDIYNKPNLEIKLLPNEINGDISTVTVKNIGKVGASNLILTLEVPKKIVGYSIFTTENLTILTDSVNNHNIMGFNFFNVSNSREQNPGIIKLQVPRFIQGNGSMIKIVTFMDSKENNNYRNYNVYATYDEGSIWKGIYKYKNITFKEKIDILWSSISWNWFLFPFIAIYSYFSWIIFIRKKYRKRIRHLADYMKIMDSVHSVFNHDNEECLKRLNDIQKEFTDKFKAGVIPDWQYDLLNKKFLFYVSYINNRKNSINSK